MKGRIKFFDSRRAYGFVTPLEQGREVMIHAKAVKGSFAHAELQAGVYVDLDVEERGAGLYATAIRLIFTSIDLPPGGMHRWAVKHNKTGIVEIFMHDEAPQLIAWLDHMARTH